MRKNMFVGSWKTYKTTVAEVRDFFKELPPYSARFRQEFEVVLCPSVVHMEAASTLMPPNIKLGAQDCSPYGGGAHTGETSAAQLAALGVKYCIAGHVERRKSGETDQQINGKVKQCLAAGISPIICFGETLIEYDNNQTRIVLERQMRDCLVGITNLENVVLCYMPIWSIGTGFYTTGEYSNIIADFMRKTAVKLTGNPMSANCTILFGGQISSSNAKEYLETPEVDGVMFATAALTPKDFAEIVNTEFSVKKLLKVDHEEPKPEPKKEEPKK
jgi:triosephosphate isomerase